MIVQIILSLLFGVLSGIFWAIHEMINHHWSTFSAKHPKLDPQFWNPSLSWKNKYKDNNPDLGRNGKLVWFSDAKHLLASLTQISLVLGGVSIGHTIGLVTLISLATFAIGYIVANKITFK